jgi:hypothetical protein
MNILIPVAVSGLKPRKDKSWTLSFETGRELSGEEVSVLVDHFEGEGWLQFSPNEDIPPPPDNPADAGVKSPSERLRSHLYALYRQRGSKGSFPSFYGAYIDKLLENIRERLDQEDSS